MKKSIFHRATFTVSILLSSVCSAQIITTIAGNGNYDYSGDGVVATATAISGEGGLAFDNFGNLYISDPGNNRIRKVDTLGIISTIAGNGVSGSTGDGGPATDAELNYPDDIAFDTFGNLYIADFFNNRIRKISPLGIITTIAGNGFGAGSFGGYSGDGGAATLAELNNPVGVAVDDSGNVYIADMYNQRIRKVNTSGIITTIAGNGIGGYNGDGIPAITAQLNNPTGVCVDHYGNIYIADAGNDLVRKVNSGIIATICGGGTTLGDGGAATAALISPNNVFVDNSGNFYITDIYHQRVREVDTTGIIHTIAGNGTDGYSGDGSLATAAELNNPYVAITDNVGNVYISDGNNNRIRKVSISTTEIKNMQQQNSVINIFPNPADIQLTIVVTNIIDTINITNILGQTVYSLTSKSTQTQVDVSDWPSGIYFVKVNSSEVKKFVKK